MPMRNVAEYMGWRIRSWIPVVTRRWPSRVCKVNDQLVPKSIWVRWNNQSPTTSKSSPSA